MSRATSRITRTLPISVVPQHNPPTSAVLSAQRGYASLKPIRRAYFQRVFMVMQRIQPQDCTRTCLYWARAFLVVAVIRSESRLSDASRRLLLATFKGSSMRDRAKHETRLHLNWQSYEHSRIMSSQKRKAREDSCGCSAR